MLAIFSTIFFKCMYDKLFGTALKSIIKVPDCIVIKQNKLIDYISSQRLMPKGIFHNGIMKGKIL